MEMDVEYVNRLVKRCVSNCIKLIETQQKQHDQINYLIEKVLELECLINKKEMIFTRGLPEMFHEDLKKPSYCHVCHTVRSTWLAIIKNDRGGIVVSHMCNQCRSKKYTELNIQFFIKPRSTYELE